jgi:choline dehydrogenase-like flavoprotein
MDELLENAIFAKALNFKAKFTQDYFRKAYGREAFVQIVTVSKPLGFGTLKLKDIRPTSPLLLDPNYLSNAEDVKTLVEGIKFSVKLVEETDSFKEIHGRLLPIPIPGCENHMFKSDDYWECLGRHTTATAYKYCSTAPIGKNTSDPQAVVDSRLRVLGAKRLRVIDASVFQEKFVSVNHITCQMLGELASDFIRKEYLKSRRDQ